MADEFAIFCILFGRRVKALRLRRGLTQEDMLERGFTVRHYQRIEAGRSVTMRTLWKMAMALDVEPRVLLPTRIDVARAGLARPAKRSRPRPARRR